MSRRCPQAWAAEAAVVEVLEAWRWWQLGELALLYGHELPARLVSALALFDAALRCCEAAEWERERERREREGDAVRARAVR